MDKSCTSVIVYLFLVVCIGAGCNNKTQQSASSSDGTVVVDMHNSRNSLDWSGIYRGTLPCADCEGIKTEIKLDTHGGYNIARQYLGESRRVYKDSGQFIWNDKGSNIYFEKENEEKAIFQVAENALVMLDQNGERISSEIADKYRLKKVSTDKGIIDKYWMLIKLNGKLITANIDQEKVPHFILQSSDKRVFGNGGCNMFSGGFELAEKNEIEFSQLISTKMACMDVNYENEYLKMLAEANSFQLNDDSLLLMDEENEIIAEFNWVFFEHKK